MKGEQIIGSLDLPPEVEKELVYHILKLKETLGITSKDLRELAIQAAEQTNTVLIQ